MGIVNGKVEAMSNKFGKFSILVNEKWYSSKFEINASRGDVVEFDDGGRNYAQKLRVVGGSAGASQPEAPANSGPTRSAAPGFPVGTSTKDRSIVRQNSLAHATNLVTTTMTKILVELPEDFDGVEKLVETYAKLTIDVARMYEDYSAGDEITRDLESA